MAITIDVKQIDDISVLSISGRITQDGGSSNLRDSIREFVHKGNKK